MTKAKFPVHRSSLFLVLGLGLALSACGGNEPPPAAPPPPPPPPAATTAAPPPPPPPAPVAEVPPPAPKHHHGHGIEVLLTTTLDTIDLKPEQKTAVEGIETDMDKLDDAGKEPHAKLANDLADGVAAGKIDHKKTEADVKALSDAVAATEPSMQDAMNRLYKTLDVDQRKKLIETMREKGKEMKEHFAEHEAKSGKGHEAKPAGAGHEEMHDARLDKLADALSLTPEQKTKLHARLEAQMKAQHANMKFKMAAMEKHMDSVGTAFEGDKFDAKKAGVGSQTKDMVKTMATDRIEFVETVLAVLTPEQRSKFADHMKAHANEEGHEAAN